MSVIAIFAVITGFCLVLIYILIKALQKKCKENEELANENDALYIEVEEQKKNIVQLFHYSEEIAEIEKSQRKTGQQICGAKSNEEVIDIINSVIRNNNNRVRDNG